MFYITYEELIRCEIQNCICHFICFTLPIRNWYLLCHLQLSVFSDSFTLPIRNWYETVFRKVCIKMVLHTGFTLPIRNWYSYQPAFSYTVPCLKGFTLPIRNWYSPLTTFFLEQLLFYITYKELIWDTVKFARWFCQFYITYEELILKRRTNGVDQIVACFTLPIRNWYYFARK